MPHYSVDVPSVASEVFDGEVVVANFVSGVYYAIAGTGAAVWMGLRAGHSSEDLAAWLAGRFGIDAPKVVGDVEDFVRSLVDAGLAAPAEGAPQGALPDLPLETYAEPKLERHDDLQDLLLLDPVHDVAEAGWPHLPQDKD